MLSRLTLTKKMLLASLLVGALSWFALDSIHTRQVRALFNRQVMHELQARAAEDRIYFDHYVRSHHQAARLFTHQENMTDYLRRMEARHWSADPAPKPVILDTPPPWYPGNSILRIFAQPRFALLLDPKHRVREVYRSMPQPLPKGLLDNRRLIAKLSHSSGLLTEVDTHPYLLSSSEITGKDGRERGSVILASPLDSELLYQAQDAGRDNITVLFEQGRVIATNRQDLIRLGSTAEQLRRDYVVTSTSFFDYGDSDLLAEFASLTPTATVRRMGDAILHKERYQHAFNAFILIGFFTLLVVWIARHVRNVTTGIVQFSQETLGASGQAETSGDELYVLERQFHRFKEEIVASHEALAAAVAEQTRNRLEAAQQARIVTLLRSVTEALGVGVLAHEGGKLQPMNAVMERFVSDIGDPGAFEVGDASATEREFPSANGSRLFDIRQPPGQFLLVKEVTGERELKRRLRLAVEAIDNATDGIFVAGGDGRIQLVNPSFSRITGREEGAFLDPPLPFLHALAIGEPLATEIDETLQQGFGWEGEFPLAAAGTPRRIWLRMDILPDADGRISHYVGILTDVTERFENQERLRRYAEELRISNEEVRNFAYIVSHDLRSPLVNIRGFVGELRHTFDEVLPLLSEAAPHLTAEQRQRMETACHGDMPEALTFIDGSVRKMDELISAILRLSRIGRRELNPERLDMNALVRTQLASLNYELEQHGTEVVVKPLPELFSDRTCLEQVFGNLLSNAVKFLDPGRPGRITVWAEQVEDKAIFHVQDNGRGIPEGDRDKVFAVFRRAGPPDIPGEGMGLAYVQAIVRRLGGTIHFTSEPGKGSCFTFDVSESIAGDGPGEESDEQSIAS